MAIIRPLAARSPQRPPGPTCRNKVLADNADGPDDVHEPDDLDESDNSMVSSGPSVGLLEASWGPLGASWGPRGGLSGASVRS